MRRFLVLLFLAGCKIDLEPGDGDSMTVDIDAAWLAARTAPYFLDGTGETYVLQTDVTTDGTAFIVCSAENTLDLNGHTITYCNRAPVTIPNGDFETPDFTGWDFSHALSFNVVPASPYAHGNLMIQGTITTPEYFTTPAFTPSVFPYEYCACFAMRSYNSADTVKLELLLASDESVIASIVFSSRAHRGIWANYTHKRDTGDALKLRITCTPAGSSTFWIDWIQYLYSRDYGIYASRYQNPTSSWGELYYPTGVPTQIYNTPGFTTRALPSLFTLTDSTHTHSPLAPGTGLIVSGAGGPRAGFGISLYTATVGKTTIDGVRMKSTGIDGGNILGYYAIRPEITNCHLESDIPAITNRMAIGHNIFQNAGSILVEDCTILNNPNYGIGLGDLYGAVKSTIQRNTITQRGIVTERYAIVLGQVNNTDILNNTINVATNSSGRGILIDSAASGQAGTMKDIHIAYNNITVSEKKNVEYPITGLEVPGIRIRDYGNKGIWNNIEIDHNTIHAETGQTDDHVHAAYGIRIWMMNAKGYSDNSKLFIHDNNVTALCSRARGSYTYHAAALAIDSLDPHIWPLIYNNNFESNCYGVLLGGYSDGYALQSQDIWMESNTHIKSATYPGLFTFQSIALGSQDTSTNRPIGGVFILDPKYSGGAPEYWTWNDSGWSTGMTGEVLGGWVLTVIGDIPAAAISVVDSLITSRYTGTADANGDLSYVPGPTANHVHTKGQAPTYDVDTVLTPLTVNYATLNQVITPTANQVVDFSGPALYQYVFVVN